jgi:hypothetical protein
MRKLWAAAAAVLSLVVVPAVVGVAPASADNACHVGSPQINNSYVCTKATLFYDIGGYPYYVSWSTQVKSTGYVAQLQVRNGQNGAWYGCGPQISYSPFSQGVVNGWCGSTWRPTRARIVLTNTITGAQSTYSWNPFPLV